MYSQKRPNRGIIAAAWLAVQEGATFYTTDESDPDTFHEREDCPRLRGKTIIDLVVVNGVLESEGYYYRNAIPCDMCIKRICIDE